MAGVYVGYLLIAVVSLTCWLAFVFKGLFASVFSLVVFGCRRGFAFLLVFWCFDCCFGLFGSFDNGDVFVLLELRCVGCLKVRYLRGNVGFV